MARINHAASHRPVDGKVPNSEQPLINSNLRLLEVRLRQINTA